MRNIVVAALATAALPAHASGLPTHTVKISAMALHEGKRVQINVDHKITKDDCLALIAKYEPVGRPDGQVSVRVPAPSGAIAPWCVQNFNGAPVFFNKLY